MRLFSHIGIFLISLFRGKRLQGTRIAPIADDSDLCDNEIVRNSHVENEVLETPEENMKDDFAREDLSEDDNGVDDTVLNEKTVPWHVSDGQVLRRLSSEFLMRRRVSMASTPVLYSESNETSDIDTTVYTDVAQLKEDIKVTQLSLGDNGISESGFLVSDYEQTRERYAGRRPSLTLSTSRLELIDENRNNNEYGSFAENSSSLNPRSSLRLSTTMNYSQRDLATMSAKGLDSDVVLIDSDELYNMFNDGDMYRPYIRDPLYVLLIDIRDRDAYERGHILTAINHPCGDDSIDDDKPLKLPLEKDIRCFSCVVIYDDTSATPEATLCLHHFIYSLLNIYKIKGVMMLADGFADFKEKNPCMITCRTYHSVEDYESIDTYPSVILSNFLYLGTYQHASKPIVQEKLGFTHIINISSEHGNAHNNVEYLVIPINDTVDVDIHSQLDTAIKFIENVELTGGKVLVHCTQGISRSASVVIAFLMHRSRWTLKEAFEYTKNARPIIRPNRAFLRQLSQYEVQLLGSKMTDITEYY